jgi:hypothetical protein
VERQAEQRRAELFLMPKVIKRAMCEATERKQAEDRCSMKALRDKATLSLVL